MTYRALLLVSALSSIWFSPAHAAEQWDSKLIDTHPAAEDLTLPMPCGGAMVFRPVDVPAGSGELDDTAITIGRKDSQDGYNQFLRTAWLGAPFTVPSHKDLQRYYIGKYDVTRNQYNAMMSGQCTAATAAGRLPQTQISFKDAQDFAANWTVWLLKNARDKLPQRQKKPGFIRLPTDAEWSYAARGGMKVSPSDFLAQTWPMSEGAEQYIAAGPDVGGVQPVGSLKPNPLGLYDMLGNVDQMLQESYSLNRVGRLQGLNGGILTRGGNYLANPDELSTSLRGEVPPYNPATADMTKLPTLGFRVVIGAEALGSLEATQQAQAAFDAILTHAEQQSSDTHKLLEALARDATDPATKLGLERINAQIASDARARTDVQMTALRAQYQALIALGNTIWESQNIITQIDSYISSTKSDPTVDLSGASNNLARHKTQLAGQVSGFISLVQAMSDSANDTPLLTKAADLEREAIAQRGQTYQLSFLSVAQEKVMQAHKSGLPTPDDVLTALKKITPQGRDTK
ncbi:SUMF1/EgtB/PvdO family nonheme iron enzyme [Acetobacter malorum]|uniref:formylglycine-generating enzyme family protein n=1 Tax=Acetobacter malorum TaxID=178901 RepID=UPI0007771C22|nr:SUMF1/EgtB/PvdO family nonheme iron enzyme [Acetobacter malorum]